MRCSKKILAVLFVICLTTLGLAVVAPLAAKPGWSMENHPALDLSKDQLEQIANLKAAYHDRIRMLDWSPSEGGHSPETLREAGTLRLALRAEIREVLTREQRERMDSAHRGCPHTGQTQARPEARQGVTLYL